MISIWSVWGYFEKCYFGGTANEIWSKDLHSKKRKKVPLRCKQAWHLQMVRSRLFRGQEFKVSGKLFSRIEEGLNKNRGAFGKAGETVIFLLKGSVINLTVPGTVSHTKLLWLLNVHFELQSSWSALCIFLLCLHLYSVCAWEWRIKPVRFSLLGSFFFFFLVGSLDRRTVRGPHCLQVFKNLS